MKRWMRRTAAIILGLVLGWHAAGWWSGIEAAEVPRPPAAGGDAGAEPADAAHADPGQQAAGKLVPEATDVRWLKPAAAVSGGLFVAALVLGVPALRFKGPPPTDVADAGGAAHH